MKKRICSLLLALALVCSLLPGAALAEEPDRTAYPEGGIIYNLDTGTVVGPVNKNTISTARIAETVNNVQISQISQNAFAGCSKLTTVTLPTSITEIGMSAFENCTQLKTVTVKMGTPSTGLSLSIRSRAFANCKVLTTVELPKTMVSIDIGDEVFVECAALKTIDLPEGVFSLGARAFTTSGLTSVTLPSSLTNLGESVFESCTALEKIVILEGGCTAISKRAFAGCTNKKLTTVSLPATVSEIGESAFEGCTSLTSVVLPGAENTPNGAAVSGVTKIGPRAFAFCENLETMCLPASLTTIGDNAFSACAKLKILHYGGASADTLPNKDAVAQGKDIHCTLTSSIITRVASCNLEGITTDKIACDTCGKTVRTEERPTQRLSHTQQPIPATPATCTATGLTEGFTCTVCNEVLQKQETIPALGHTEVSRDGNVTTPATCGKDGEQEVIISCTECKKDLRTEKKILPALTGEHTPGAEEVESRKEPTCGEDGLEILVTKCSKCDTELDRKENILDATGVHTKGDESVEKTTKDPSCTEDGVRTITPLCSVCGGEITDQATTEPITMLPHQPDETKEITVTSTATCTDAGKKTTAATCKECKNPYTLEEDEEALGHDWKTLTDPVVTKPATCTEAGQQTSGIRVCQRENCPSKGTDGKPYQDPASGTAETIPALGHNREETVEDEAASKAPTCTEAGVKVIKATVCTRCSAAIPEERTELPAAGHTKGADTVEKVITEATCTEPGLSEVGFTCTVCGEPVDSVTTAVPAKGHTYGEWTVIKEATATVPGSRERTCSVCQNKETEEIPATGSSKPEDPDDEREYDIDLIRTSNGSVTLPTHAAAGETVVIRVYPYSGYELDWIEVTRWNGREIRLYSSSDTRYTFTMPSADVEVRAYFTRISDSYHSSSSGTWRPSTSTSTSTPSPGPQTVIQPAPQASGYTAGFSDVPAGHWASGEIGWASQNGYMSGVGGGRFNPSGSISHRQLWMVLARFMGVYPADMEAARIWAVENGFAVGTNPVSPVTRQQLVVALYRTARLSGSLNGNTASLAKYEDSRLVSASARNAMSWAVANGIISGNANACLNPNGTVTRDQFAVILFRFSQRR